MHAWEASDKIIANNPFHAHDSPTIPKGIIISNEFSKTEQ